MFSGTANVMSNVDLIAGSSQHGKHLLASVASNCVTAAYLSSPSGLKYVYVKLSNMNIETLCKKLNNCAQTFDKFFLLKL